MANNFPTALNSYVTGTTSAKLATAGHAAEHNALEAKLGIDSSAVTTSIDYLLKNAASIDPGHLHTSAGISGTLTLAKGGTNQNTWSSSQLVRVNAAGTALESSGQNLPASTIVGISDNQTLTNKTITDATNNVMAKSLKSATTTVDVSAAAAPTNGQVLTATSGTAATWQTPAAAGVTVQDRSISTTTVSNTTVETNVYSFAVPGSTIGTNKMLRATLNGQYLNNSGGSSNLTVNLKYGATTIATSTRTFGTGTATWDYQYVFHVVANGATNAQIGFFYGLGREGGTSTDAARGTAAIDSTASQNLVISVTHSVANVNISFSKYLVITELV